LRPLAFAAALKALQKLHGTKEPDEEVKKLFDKAVEYDD